jgi:hypothetical protein
MVFSLRPLVFLSMNSHTETATVTFTGKVNAQAIQNTGLSSLISGIVKKSSRLSITQIITLGRKLRADSFLYISYTHFPYQNLFPQTEQNLAVPSHCVPHSEQNFFAGASALPHSRQNFAAASAEAPHCGQVFVPGLVFIAEPI